MSQIYAMHKRKVLAAGGLVGTLVLFRYANLPNPFYTPGVQNIEKRYSSGGGSKNHSPGTATARGNSEDVEANTLTNKGMGTPHHQERYGEQRPDPTAFDKTWNQAHYHADRGK